MPKPLVSVLVPCCNVEKYVGQCLESILSQTLKEIEVICVNDGSRDGTLRILKEFAARDPRIQLIDKPNTGYGDSMNKALDRASGEYVGIVESDDFVEPVMFERLYEEAKGKNLDISRGCYYRYVGGEDTLVPENRVPKNTVVRPRDCTDVFFQGPAIWASIYRRDWLVENGIRFLPTPGASFQDTSFSFKAFALAERFQMIDTALHHYRCDNTSSSSHSTAKVFAVCDEWKEIYRFVEAERRKFEKLLRVMPRLQYNTYRWNFKRIAPELRPGFMEEWSKEIQDFRAKGLIIEDALSLRGKFRLRMIEGNPGLALKLLERKWL